MSAARSDLFPTDSKSRGQLTDMRFRRRVAQGPEMESVDGKSATGKIAGAISRTTGTIARQDTRGAATCLLTKSLVKWGIIPAALHVYLPRPPTCGPDRPYLSLLVTRSRDAIDFFSPESRPIR